MASGPHPPPANAEEAFERLGRMSLRELSMDNLLQTVADMTAAVMPGNTEASVTLLVKEKPTTAGWSGQLASMRANRKVRDIADDLVRTGAFPGAWSPRDSRRHRSATGPVAQGREPDDTP